MTVQSLHESIAAKTTKIISCECVICTISRGDQRSIFHLFQRDNSHYYGHITYHRTGNQVQLMKTFREVRIFSFALINLVRYSRLILTVPSPFQLVISGHRKEILSIISEILPGHDQELRYLTSLIVKRDSPETTKVTRDYAWSIADRTCFGMMPTSKYRNFSTGSASLCD